MKRQITVSLVIEDGFMENPCASVSCYVHNFATIYQLFPEGNAKVPASYPTARLAGCLRQYARSCNALCTA